MANALEKRFTYDVGGVEEELTTSQRSDVQLAVTEKQPIYTHIHGEQGTFIERDFVRTFLYCENQ